MCPIDETNLPRSPEIVIERLRTLLLDLPRDWRLFADDRARLLLVDDHDQPKGYIDQAHQRIVILDGGDDGDTDEPLSLI